MSTYYKLQGTLVRETEKAVLFQTDTISGAPVDNNKELWYPLSQISSKMVDPNNKGEDWIMASEWILQQKGFL